MPVIMAAISHCHAQQHRVHSHQYIHCVSEKTWCRTFCNKVIGEKYYTYFIDNLLLFTTVSFQNRLTVDEVIARSSTPRFFLRHTVYIIYRHIIRTTLRKATLLIGQINRGLTNDVIWNWSGRVESYVACVQHSTKCRLSYTVTVTVTEHVLIIITQ